MASFVSRELKVTYGALVVGGTTEYEIHDVLQWDHDYAGFRFSMEVIVRGDTEALATTAWAAIEAEFRKRDQALTIEQGAVTLHTYDPSDFSVLNIQSTCRKSGDPQKDTGRSRSYIITFTGGLAAADVDGLRDFRIRLSFDAARRLEITYTGTWTADAASASTEYLDHSPAWMASQNTAFSSGRTLKMVSEVYEPDRNDAELTFTVVWREIIQTTTASALSHADVTDYSLRMRLSKPAPGDSAQGIVRLRDCTAQFECSIDSENNTAIEALWESTLLAYIDGQVEATFGPQQIARIDEHAEHIPTGNRIVATVVYRLAIGATNVVESRITQGYEDDPGIDFTPAWESDAAACYVDQGPQIPLRVTERTVMVLGVVAPKSVLGEGGDFIGIGGSNPNANPGSGLLEPEQGGASPNPNGWNLVPPISSRATTLWLGPEDMQFAITMLQERRTERRVSRPSGGGRSGRGGINPGGGTPVIGIGGPNT